MATTLVGPVRSAPDVPSARRSVAWSLAEVRWASASTVLFAFGLAAHFSGAPTWLSWTLFLSCYVTGGWEPGWAGLQALRE